MGEQFLVQVFPPHQTTKTIYMNWKMIGTFSAFLGAVIFVALTILAVVNYPGYSVYSNFLSDLGTGENSAVFFNIAVMISGTAAVVLSIALNKIFSKSNECKLASIILAIAGISLVGIGVFTENHPIHSSISALFFACISASMILFGISFRKDHSRWYVFSILGILVPVFFLLDVKSLAEHLAISSVLIWSFAVGSLIYRKADITI
ncbi:MAG: DUF998 domain-containing protein [Candidatus Aenigmarchaeota archaeon]|nr:DUF998 domain-containing protein [Candidatus Aenigmarchaeota archaeon]